MSYLFLPNSSVICLYHILFFLFLVRSLPDFNYLGTIRDSETNSGSVTSISQQEIDNKLHLVTGGLQLRVWNQVAPRARGRKRKK